ncbi:MAG: rhomboid family intramembrane serine protease [Candidatus Sulfotelmatobacter sp.]|jgi:membrane associated rhomboid family serine protease/Tfp pilus assembly protein PilF
MPAFSFKKICPWCVQHEAAQRGELDENARQPVITAPWVQRESTVTLTQVIFGANVMVFIAMVIASGPSLDFTGQVELHFGANYGPLTLSGDWWRLVTYMFLHGGLMHIAFNMWCLWDLGRLCESLYGRWTFAAIYLITGVAGGLASIAWNPEVLSVGASGAIFGLAGALAASFYLGEFSIPKVAIQGTLRSLLFFIGFNVLFGAMVPGIDNACHGGGLVSGLILGALIARVAPQHDSPRRIGVLGMLALAVVVAAFGVQRWRGSDLHFRSAIVAQKSVDRIIAELQKKLKQNPRDASAHYALAHEYFSSRQIPEGIGELKRVLELQPQNANARLDLGAAYLSQGQAKEAQEEFTKFVAQEPNQVDGHAGLGMALADQGNHPAAIEEYKAALRLDPRAGGVYYKLGISQAQLKQYDDAIASYQKEQQQSGDDPELENALADGYQAKGMTQQAQAARDKAAQLKSGQRD